MKTRPETPLVTDEQRAAQKVTVISQPIKGIQDVPVLIPPTDEEA